MKNLLVHLCNSSRTKSVVETAVKLASVAQARIRGVSILDTRTFFEKAGIESAAYAGVEATRMTLTHRRQMQSREEFLSVCRSSRVHCDVVDVRGDPIELLADEAKYNDLTIVSYGRTPHRHDVGLSAHELMELAQRGAHPLLVLRRKPVELDRVLLIYDGSNASSRSIRSFLSQHAAYLGNQYRLLCVGEAASPQSGAYRAMLQYCRSRMETLEVGCLPGSPVKTAAKYAQKWEADLLVLGVARTSSWWGSPFGQLGSDILQHTELAIYAYA
ncbi:universal stress protein [Blastopirellula marina]|uniref:UspA domain-containing protein n=1 Tax=Blastopirellula marina DSM 3645 TaxID=314230 RepID=A4A1T6_9BACT|nr:universal stress protein [Blastopirellula marina]EAQ77302.1 hypothetical protein DSM3645_29491 [Blastopirellula marina DSM 3645]